MISSKLSLVYYLNQDMMLYIKLISLDILIFSKKKQFPFWSTNLQKLYNLIKYIFI